MVDPSRSVTVAIVPREARSRARVGLDAVLASVPAEAPVVHVDGAAPARARRFVDAAAARRPMTVVRTAHTLTPNEARNLALAHVATRYVVFVDDDVVPQPGWLEALVACAEETGAAAVAPLYFSGDYAARCVHMAGGDARVEEHDGARRYVESHRHGNTALAAIEEPLVRTPTEQLEFHCMLVRTEVLQRLGPLDEGLRSQFEHTDLCMRIHRDGGTTWLEPAAHVAYQVTPATWSDLPYHVVRWSTAWNEASRRQFAATWQLPLDDPRVAASIRFCERHRLDAYAALWRPLTRVAGGHTFLARWGRRLADATVHPVLVGRAERRRRRARPPTVVPPVT
jgi:GT2 family glycosyltransferase